MKELPQIQKKLVCAKSRLNKHTGYFYRSCEDIFEAVKPILAEHECELVVSDEIVQIGERFYVKATAVLTNKDGETKTSTAFARETDSPASKMDPAQYTGACSSYARKYALSGLFCIDDAVDIDEATGEEQKPVDKNVERDLLKRIKAAKTQEEITSIYTAAPNEFKVATSDVYKACVARRTEIVNAKKK